MNKRGTGGGGCRRVSGRRIQLCWVDRDGKFQFQNRKLENLSITHSSVRTMKHQQLTSHHLYTLSSLSLSLSLSLSCIFWSWEKRASIWRLVWCIRLILQRRTTHADSTQARWIQSVDIFGRKCEDYWTFSWWVGGFPLSLWSISLNHAACALCAWISRL